MRTTTVSQSCNRPAKLSAGLVIGCSLFGAAAIGAPDGWPTDPATPLIAGVVQGSFGPRISMESSEEGVWLAWQDRFCLDGFVRLQRIAPDGSLLSQAGLEVQDDPTCGFMLPPAMTRIGTGVAVSRAASSLVEFPVQGVGSDGSSVWEGGFSTTTLYTLGPMTRLASGDTLIVSRVSRDIRVDRLSSAGSPVWLSPTVFESPSGSNMEVRHAVPTADGGAHVYWDAPRSYDRLIFSAGIAADGTLAWGPKRVVDTLTGATDAGSRHSPPAAVGDGAGGSYLFWTKGFEQGTTPAPLFMQHVDAAGNLAFVQDTVRVSLGSLRQFDVQAHLDDATGDVVVVWRDGQQSAMTVRAQRMSPSGDRLWGDTGVHVSTLDPTVGSFDAVWADGCLSIAIGDDSGVSLFRLDSAGVADLSPIPVSDATPARCVVTGAAGDAVVVAWQNDEPGLDDLVMVQRVRSDGTLGGPACSPADTQPDGVLNFFDVSAYLTLFNGGDACADLAEPAGTLNFFDISAFLALFNAGCP